MPWTTARRVETGLLAEEGLVLHCVRSRVSIGSCSLFPPRSVRRCAFDMCNLGPGGLVDVRFARKNSPEMLSCSQRTTTTFWPFRSCFATVEARRPRRWPLPSTTTCIFHQPLLFLPYPPCVYPPGRASARKWDSLSGMRTTGSKVDMMLWVS